MAEEPVVRTADAEPTGDFSSLMISRTSLQALAKAGIKKPSPVQAKALPLGLLGFDMLVQAKSGTGKTLVFSLLALENLNAQFDRPQVLIVAPTREIAAQITSYITMLAPRVVHVGIFVGGNGKSVAEDIQKLKKSLHIVVGTTGRLCHLVRIDALRLNYVRLLVLDEADKLMQDDFQQDINYLFLALPPEKQVTVFSATYPHRLDSVLKLYMRDMHVVRVGADQQLLGVKQYVVIVADDHNKLPIIEKLLLQLCYSQCIIFVNDRQKCVDVFTGLHDHFRVTCMSGDMSQHERTKVMKQLKNCMVKQLISTDLTARGIDVTNVNLVINFGCPPELSTYLHRIGRAGRFGTHGAAITVINSDKDLKLFSDIFIGGKLRLKLLRSERSEEWPSNLIYNEEYFDNSDDFCPYLQSPLFKREIVKSDEESTFDLLHSDSDPQQQSKLEEGEIAYKNGRVTLLEKFEESIYWNQDFHNVGCGMREHRVSDDISGKLVAAKDMDGLRKSKEGICAAEEFPCSADDRADFEVMDRIGMQSCSAGPKKRRYLRNQLLSFRETLSDEEWLRYAEFRFGTAMKKQPFVKRRFPEIKNEKTLCSSAENRGEELVITSDESEVKEVENAKTPPLLQNRAECAAAGRKTKQNGIAEEQDENLIKINAAFYYALSKGLGNMVEKGISPGNVQTCSVAVQAGCGKTLDCSSHSIQTGDLPFGSYKCTKIESKHEERVQQNTFEGLCEQWEHYLQHVLNVNRFIQ